MFIVRGTATFAPGEVERLRDQLVEYVRYVRSIDGCIDYCYAVDLHDRSTVHVIEAWRDHAAHEAYLADLSVLMDILSGTTVEQMNVNAYEAQFSKTVMKS